MSSNKLNIKTGADLIAAFIGQQCFPKVFLVTGGAAAFMVDALDRNPSTDYVCVQHEQAASMAVDAIWRTSKKVGVSMATSGPGATNLITGIASSWFDSIPSLHITGQVNDRESKETIGANVRQAGFQETDIVSMVSSITKFAVKVKTVSELAQALRDGYFIAGQGRMGPVLIDVPMNVQQEIATEADFQIALSFVNENESPETRVTDKSISETFTNFLAESERPLFVFGGGAGLAGVSREIQDWCEKLKIPYVASWAGMTYLDRSLTGYQGTQGVYGLRHANWCVQAADKIVVLGSRLDNRQRTGNPKAYAPFAQILVVDVDEQEIQKFHNNVNFSGLNVDLEKVSSALEGIEITQDFNSWNSVISEAKVKQSNNFDAGVLKQDLDPYKAVSELQNHFGTKPIVIADTGATLCWTFQAFAPDQSHLFTSGGNSPMGYSLPAAVGAQIANPESDVICIIGDGGFQMNIQELQTAIHYETPITIVIFNNSGYGIIKQFQDSNTNGNYAATGRGYSVPNFGSIANAYGIPYHRVDNLSQISNAMAVRELKIIELVIPENALVTPKAEGDHFIHDQFPYDREEKADLPFNYPLKPSLLNF